MMLQVSRRRFKQTEKGKLVARDDGSVTQAAAAWRAKRSTQDSEQVERHRSLVAGVLRGWVQHCGSSYGILCNGRPSEVTDPLDFSVYP
jgi:hypothetical protein